MKFWKKKKQKVPFELVNRWQTVMFQNIGVSSVTDNETLKEACRKILLETSRLYENIMRTEDGMNPIEYKE